MKYINIKRYKFSTILKDINFKRYNFSKVSKYIDFKRVNFRKFNKYVDIKGINFKKAYKYLDIRKYNFHKINLKGYEKYFLYFLGAIIFLGFVYILVPLFYNYDKSKIEAFICKNQNIKCFIKGKINYSFFPTPRIEIKNLIIKYNLKSKKPLVETKNATIKLIIKNLIFKEKQKFKNIELNNFKINVNLKKLSEYQNVFFKNSDFIPITFKKGEMTFFNKNDYVATIKKANLSIKEDFQEIVLKGNFLKDQMYFNLERQINDAKPSTNIIFKMSNFNLLLKSNFYNFHKGENSIAGNILIKKDKHRLTGLFDYYDKKITITKSNIKNVFLNGDLDGKIEFFPYFDFNLDLDLKSINFTKLYSYFLSLDNDKQKKIFKINKKINGRLNLSSEKIYSSYNLVKSFESRIKFNNGNILLEQFLLNLGKLGAADILGTISNDKKFTNLKYESNVFVDNEKKFLSKFGVYNKKNISSNFFISGNFDLSNIKNSFYEISHEKKLPDQDVNYIEKEFNEFLLKDGYKNLFRFPKFVEFIKSITSDIN